VFWSVWVPPALPGPEAALTTLEQIDVVHQLCDLYPDLVLATTSEDIRRAHRQGKIASLIGMEGGGSIGDSLGALRMMYAAGARYLTLTHWLATSWADAATDAPQHGGLSPFGETVIREMNRLGMLVDLSHVSADTMRDALRVSEAPVIFSHSGAFAENPHPRNVPDDVLELVKANGGVVMVDFLPAYVSAEVRAYEAERKAEKTRQQALHTGDPAGAKAALAAWVEANPAPRATLAQVADHLDHVREQIGAPHAGLGSDFDGMDVAPAGLEDVSRVPDLLVELLRRGWTDEEVAGVAGENLLRVMEAAEELARSKAGQPASNARIHPVIPLEHE
jgi:membrane dipeptidase